MHRLWQRLGLIRSEEGGFTLTEAVVAVGLVGVILGGSTAVAMSSLRSVADAKAYQQATEIGNEMVENARDLDYADLYMRTSDLAGDPNILAGNTFDPDGGEPALSAETLVHAASGGSIVPHVTTVTIGGQDFTVRRYVTAPTSGVAQGLRRFTVNVTWEAGGRTATYSTAALIARARRGLPVPRFRLDDFPPQGVTGGSQLVIPYTVKNRGIVDAYDITSTVSRPWMVRFFADTDNDGAFDPGIDTNQLLDTNFNSVADTGNIDTDETVRFFLVYDVPASEATGDVIITVTATSGADDTQIDEETATIRVGSTGTTMYLHNGASPVPAPSADTIAVANMAMSIDVPTAGPLYRYSTNLYNPIQVERGGRLIRHGGVITSETTDLRANWAHRVPAGQPMVLDGTARALLWVAQQDFGCDRALNFTVSLRSRRSMTQTNGSNTPVLLASRDVLLPAPPAGSTDCRWQEVPVDLPIGATVDAGHYLELKITVNATTGTGVLFAYDTTTYPATLALPTVVSG